MTERKSKTWSNNVSHHQPESEQPEMSSDENDEENRVNDDFFDKDAEHYFKNKETPKQRCSPSKRSHTPKSICDPDGTKQPTTPTQYSRSESIEQKSIKNKKTLEKNSWPILLFVIVSIISGIIYFKYPIGSQWFVPTEVHPSMESKNFEEIKKFKKTIKEIKSQFPSQNRHTWTDIEAGIIDIINGSQKPWTFVLYSNETRDISCLAKMLGKASSKALHSEDSLELEARHMGDDYGLAIERLKPQIDAKKAVVVYDVLEINPRAIQVFHTMCDRETPLIKSAVYVLTIITSGNIPQFEKPIEFVENQLTNRFINKVPKDKLQPLITRLTDGPIIPVEREINFSECPL